MKTVRIICITVLLIAFASLSSAAVVKWSQMPSMQPFNGYSFSSETQVPAQVADDFLCENGLPVIGLTWWGSYWDPIVYPYSNSATFGDPASNPPGIVRGFNINIYSDVPAGSGFLPWSHPGAQGYSQYVPLDGMRVTEKVFGQIQRPASTQTVFQYDAKLPVPFEQVAGNIYWLSIQAVDPQGNPLQWGWQESVDHWNDNAVQIGYARQGWWDLLTGEDMAFETKAIPIPGAVWLLGAGLLGLLGLRKRG